MTAFLVTAVLVAAGVQAASGPPESVTALAGGSDRGSTAIRALLPPGAALQEHARVQPPAGEVRADAPAPSSTTKAGKPKSGPTTSSKSGSSTSKKSSRSGTTATNPAKRPARSGSTASKRANRAPKKSAAPSGGADISWPQCPDTVGIPDLRGLNQPMPHPDTRFVIVGLTNGRAFTRNPCLAMHLRWVKNHHVWASAYAFATYPTRDQQKLLGHLGPFDGRTKLGKLRNAGYRSALYNIRTMRAHGFTTPHVWLDVEKSPSRPWSGNVQHNKAVVDGWIKAYRQAGYTVGFYSTIAIWRDILGDTRYRYAEWRTAGPSNQQAAFGRCHEQSFQGGRAVVAQWWDRKRDYNRMCPGFDKSPQMKRYFHKY